MLVRGGPDDRSAGPVSDTWPVVDYYPDTGEERMIHRTMDGWCQTCVNEWESGDFGAEFTLDVYLRRATPARNFLDYALFVTFFPHLVAGPIMRPTELVPQFEQPRRATAQPDQTGFE
mgnify:CR=1 FL=1